MTACEWASVWIVIVGLFCVGLAIERDMENRARRNEREKDPKETDGVFR